MTDTAKYEATFSLVDANNDGRIGASELQSMMTALGKEVSDERAAEMIRKMDGDGDGEISLEEFAAFMSSGAN